MALLHKKACRMSLGSLAAALLVALVNGAPDVCLGEFEVCPDGVTCVLDASLCGVCKSPGEFLCPDGVTCVPSAEAVQFCPIVTPLFNWTLDISSRVAGTLANLTLEEKAALIIMVSPVRAVPLARKPARIAHEPVEPACREFRALGSPRSTTGRRLNTG